jgi:3-oxoacyl-[acyl-carrier protein] reductase
MSENKPVALISGGSRGLGRALVSQCLMAGYRVATFSRSANEYIRNQIDEDPKNENFYWDVVNVNDVKSLQSFVNATVKCFGKIDMLINNVGVAVDGILSVTSAMDIHNCIDSNLKGTIFLTQQCSKVMLKQKFGSIVNISSVNAIRGHSGVAVYSATKSAIDGLTRSLARELGSMNIRVNSIAPGYFESDMVSDLTQEQKDRIARRTPLKRLANINEIVNGIMFLLSPSASFITGQTLVIDGGITC